MKHTTNNNTHIQSDIDINEEELGFNPNTDIGNMTDEELDNLSKFLESCGTKKPTYTPFSINIFLHLFHKTIKIGRYRVSEELVERIAPLSQKEKDHTLLYELSKSFILQDSITILTHILEELNNDIEENPQGKSTLLDKIIQFSKVEDKESKYYWRLIAEFCMSDLHRTIVLILDEDTNEDEILEDEDLLNSYKTTLLAKLINDRETFKVIVYEAILWEKSLEMLEHRKQLDWVIDLYTWKTNITNINKLYDTQDAVVDIELIIQRFQKFLETQEVK